MELPVYLRFLTALFSLLAVYACSGLNTQSQNRPIQLISGAAPVYPAQAKNEKIPGSVTVTYDVTAQGQVTNPRVILSEPAGVFDDAAIAAVSSWRFKAALKDGAAQRAEGLTSTLTFRAE